MKPRTAGFFGAVLLSAAVFAHCGKSPTQTYYHLVAAAKMGDADAFLKFFTKDSANLIESLIRLSETYGFSQNSPYRLLVMDRVTNEEITKDGEIRYAVLTLESGQKRRKLKMVEVKDEWRIDAVDLERFWLERKNFTGR